ncbi:MAG: substrate-binding domain-containing protein [Clostridiales bacterium]|nr:substrate-binding domain-containing protein [Clostridiales bacterium]
MRKIYVLCAGSVESQLEAACKKFRDWHPDVKIVREMNGSVNCVRKVIAGDPCDIIISADSALIEKMLMPEHAEGYQVFAGNSMVLAATGYGTVISADNWKDLLLNPETTFGHYDPQADPCGYRAVMACMLADNVEAGLAQKLLDHPGRRIINPGQEEPLPQFIFTYHSSAMKKGLPFTELPDEMNLSKSELDSLYANAVVELGETKINGSAISYAFATPFASANKPEVILFLRYFMSVRAGDPGFTLKSGTVGVGPIE